MIPKQHQDFLAHAMPLLQADHRIVGVAAGGSYITDSMDVYSDIDLVIAAEPEDYSQIMDEKLDIAEKLGNVLTSFTGEHVGEPRLLVCLYGPLLLHVDLKFVSLSDIARRVEDPAILWERDGRITEALKTQEAKFPTPELQWMEDRFWAWVHYTAAKIARRELFEAIGAIGFLREVVIGPLLLMKNGKLPRGVRKLETDAPDSLPALIKTLPEYSAKSCADALKVLIDLYVELREFHAKNGVVRREQAERLAMAYLGEIAAGIRE